MTGDHVFKVALLNEWEQCVAGHGLPSRREIVKANDLEGRGSGISAAHKSLTAEHHQAGHLWMHTTKTVV